MANDCWNWVQFTGSELNLTRMVQGIKTAQETNKENRGLLWYGSYYIALGFAPPNPTLEVYEEFGSKWLDIDLDLSNLGDGFIELSGTSAWSPASEFWLKLSAVYELEFESEYEEPGSDIGGFFAGHNGVATDHRPMSYLEYSWLTRDFESIDCEWMSFESETEAIEYYKPIQAMCIHNEWERVLEIISQHYQEH